GVAAVGPPWFFSSLTARMPPDAAPIAPAPARRPANVSLTPPERAQSRSQNHTQTDRSGVPPIGAQRNGTRHCHPLCTVGSTGACNATPALGTEDDYINSIGADPPLTGEPVASGLKTL